MAGQRELRRRIRSVKNTAQITKAMQMVAATKMRRSQMQALAGRPYHLSLQGSLTRLLSAIKKVNHPLLSPNSAPVSGVLVMSTDKSLCGALNTNLFRLIQNFSLDKEDLNFYTIGKKARTFLVKTNKTLIADFENKDLVTFEQSLGVAKILVDAFLNQELKEVFLLYPHFTSTLNQTPTVFRLLPIEPTSLGKASSVEQTDNFQTEYLLEPDPIVLLDYLLNHFVQISVYQVMLETKASEHSARMIAMQNATDNARELVSDLQLSYNQTRQENITKELLEITSAMAALE